MKLLFDQNLSPRLPRLLADIYAESDHVRQVGLRDAGRLRDLAVREESRLCDCFERLRLPTAKPALWCTTEILLVARR